MADVSVVKLKVRRGTDAQRKLITLDQGELGYTTDSQRLFVGDGVTTGGTSAGVKFIADSVSNPIGLLPTVQIGDIVYNKDTSFYYVLTGSPYTALSSYKPFTQTFVTQYDALSASVIGSLTPVLSTNYSPLTAQGASQLSVYETLFNAYAGLSASTDLILTNDTNTAYIDMGINSSLYNGNAYSPSFTVAKNNDSYLYSVSGNLVVGTASPNIGDLVLFTGGSLSGTATNGGNEVMRLTNTAGPYTGFVGINTSTPNQQLTVVGNISASSVIYASGGNSNAWNTVYSVVCAASGSWSALSNNAAVNTAVTSNSGRWSIGYTGYTNLTAATASTLYTNNLSAGGSGTFGNVTVNGTTTTLANPLVAGSGNLTVNGNSIYTQPLSSSAGYDLALTTNLTNRSTYFGGTQYGYAIQATETSSSRQMSLGINPYGGNVGIGTTTPNTNLTVVGGISGSKIIYDAAGNSGQWNSTFSTVNTLSGRWGGGPMVFVPGLSAGSIQPLSGSNIASGAYASIVGGTNNTASGGYSNVAGGNGNTACGCYSNVAGGCGNTASGNYSNVAGGTSNTACGGNVAGGLCNNASGGGNVAGGLCNNASGLFSNVAGGGYNTASGNRSNVAGGNNNTVSGYFTNVAGGASNTASAWFSNVAGGNGNNASACFSNVAGGNGNNASGNYSNVAGGYCNTASGLYSNAGGYCNNASGYWSNVAGGGCNTASGYLSNVAGGLINNAGGYSSNVAGGRNNNASGSFSNVAGGCCNTASGIASIVVGGSCNTASGCYSNVAGGQNNTACGPRSNVAGGRCNTASGCYSSILGGINNNTNNQSNTFILGSSLSASNPNYTYVNNLSSQGNIIASGAVYGNTGVTLLTGVTTYTIQLSDSGNLIGAFNGNVSLSATPSGSIKYPIGFQTAVMQLSTARVYLSGGSVSVNQANGYYKTTKQYSSATLMYLGSPAGWVIFGDVSA